MPVQLVCKCGKELRISDDHAGRRIMCPSCGASHVAPGPETAPIAGAADQRPRRSVPRGKGRVAAMLALVLLLGAAAGAGWWFLFRDVGPAHEGDDLALIPANAQGFVSVRLADLWKTPAAQEAMQKARERESPEAAPAERMERETGLRPEEVERLTLVGLDMERKIAWLIVRTVQPYDRRKVLSRLAGRAVHVHQGERYYLGTGPDGRARAIYFAGTHVLAAGSEESVKRCLDLATADSPPGPFAAMIERGAGEHTALAGIDLAALSTTKAKGDPIASLLKGAGQVKLFMATLDVEEKALLEAKAQLAGEEEAKAMVETIKGSLPLIQLWLAGQQLFGGPMGKKAALGQQVLGKTKFAQQGDQVTATATLDKGSTLVELLMALPER